MRNIAILGAGGIAEVMAQTLAGMREEVHAYAVASRSLEKAEQFARDHGFEKAYGSYEAMLADPKVDLVYIAVPHSHHYQWTIASLQAGKHVLCEKAFAVNEKQAREMIGLARSKGLLLTEAIWTRYQPARRIIDDLIAEGVIGRPEVVTANLDYFITHQERSVEPYLAGGALLDVGVYTLNFASMVMGNQIRRMTASCVMYESGVDAKDNIFIEYESGGMASLYASMTDQSNRTGCISGPKGYIEVSNINNPQEIRVCEQDGYGSRLLRTIPVPKQINGYEYEVRSALAAIEAGQVECPEMPHTETLEIMRQMDECRRQLGLVFPCEDRKDIISES